MKEKFNKNKKLIIIIVSVILLLLLTIVILILATGKKTVCTYNSDQSKNGYVIETKYEITSKGKNVKKVKITEVINSKKKEILDRFEKDLNNQYKNNNKNYGGYTYKVENKNDNLTINVVVDYTKFDMKKFIKNNKSMKKYTKKNKFTLEGARELYESTGATCK